MTGGAFHPGRASEGSLRLQSPPQFAETKPADGGTSLRSSPIHTNSQMRREARPCEFGRLLGGTFWPGPRLFHQEPEFQDSAAHLQSPAYSSVLYIDPRPPIVRLLPPSVFRNAAPLVHDCSALRSGLLCRPVVASPQRPSVLLGAPTACNCEETARAPG